MRAVLVRLAVLAVAVCASAACGRPEPLPDVLLLVVDTLRADHLGVYGYSRPTSPELDRFAEESIVFDPAVAPASWTLPSVASLLTSNYPSVHGLRSRSGAGKATRMRDGLTTLASALAQAGYRTAGVGTNPWVNTPEHGLHRGFDTYEALHNERADGVHARAREILAQDDGRPVFLYLHYMDVHGPYLGRRDDSLPNLGPIDPRYQRRLTKVEMKRRPPYLGFGRNPNLEAMIRAYDRSIRSWDRSFGEWMRWLDETGRLEHTVVAIVSDHGEEFLEHGGWDHGLTLFEEQIHVPWVLRVPGEPPRRITEGVVSLIDLAPTLLGVLGLPLPESMSGRNVLAEDSDRAARTAYSETHIELGAVLRKDGRSQVAMRRANLKWILHPAGDRCFDLRADPLEQTGRECDPTGLAQAKRWADGVRQRGEALGRNEELQISPEQRARLQELGYGDREAK